MSSENLMRWSGLAALLGGVLLVVFDLLNAFFFPGEHGSEMMLTSSWFIVQMVGLAALALLILGLAGLYARQAKKVGGLGLIAFLVAFSGTMMLFGLLWSEAFLGPTVAAEAPALLEVESSGVIAVGAMLTMGLVGLGWLLFGLASLRAGALPRGAALLLMVGAVVFLVLVLLELPFLDVVLGVAVAWMGYALWSRSGEERELRAEVAT